MNLCFGPWETEGHGYNMVFGCIPRYDVVSELDPPYLCTRLIGICMGQGGFVSSGVFFYFIGVLLPPPPPPPLTYSKGSQEEGISIMTI